MQALEVGLNVFRTGLDLKRKAKGKKTRKDRGSRLWEDVKGPPFQTSDIKVFESLEVKSIDQKDEVPPDPSSDSHRKETVYPSGYSRRFFRSNMRSVVHVLTTPTADTPGTTILLHFDHKRYIFGNVSEGTQRAVIERGSKLAKVGDIFLTGQVRWSTTGGLVGLILTLADVTKTAELAQRALMGAKAAKNQAAGKATIQTLEQAVDTTLTVHGGTNLTHLLATGRRYILRKGMPVHVDEIDQDELHGGELSAPAAVDEDSASEAPNGEGQEVPLKPRDVCIPTWSDKNLRVWAIVTSPEASSHGESTPSSPSRTRKRSYHEIDGEEPALWGTPSELVKERKARDDEIRKAIVTEMFDSDWNLDTFAEKRLSEVNLPATIFIRDTGTGLIKRYEGPLPSDEHPGAAVPDVQVLVRTPWPAALRESLPPTTPSQQSLSYIVKNHPHRGTFLPQKAIELQIEKGYRWGLLSKGTSITTEDGKTITPDMVMTESRPGGGIAIVELPSSAHVKGLIARAEWRTKEVMDGVGAIIWILGPGVSQDDHLLNFMKEMSHLEHLISSSDNCSNHLAFDFAAAQTIRLSQIDPVRFSVPTYDDGPAAKSGLGSPDETETNPAAFDLLQRGMMIDLEPNFQIQKNSAAPLLDVPAVKQYTPKDAVQLGIEAREMLERDETRQQIETSQMDLPGKDAEIITLGTGSMLPSKYRNVSATLLRVPGYGSYLFDCGENTLGQLRRAFSEQELKEVLRDLKVIWISHMHADHHLGTVSVIKAWYEEVWGEGNPTGTGPSSEQGSPEELIEMLREGKRLFVVSCDAMIKWLEEYSGVEDYGFEKIVPIVVETGTDSDARTLSWRTTHIGSDTWDESLNESLTTSTGVSSIQAVPVNHCQGAYAVSFSFSDGFKFSYSGDCRPSKAFAETGKGTTVLVHEATFDDELHRDALAKKHSTTSEALAVGMAMGARRVILTHFSQRYQKIPVMHQVEGSELQFDVVDDEEEEAAGQEEQGGMIIDGEGERGPSLPTESLDAIAPEISAAADVVADVAADAEGLPSRPKTSAATEDKDGKPAVVKIRAGGEGNQDMRVGVAFDCMRVKVGEITHLEYFTPALLNLFQRRDDY
ncbi:MAG: hypothetical protein M1816_001991 [Peltula sp. TS41687]|nr:MAG: hypothetical protein M1816_001991 [Peltula sp. TS41687]